VHEEDAIVSLEVELLIWRQSVDVLLEKRGVLSHLWTSRAPSAGPLTFTPRISEHKKSQWFLLVAWVLNLHNSKYAVSMVKDETRWMPVGNLGTFFTITFDAASQKAVVLPSLEQERPEAIFASVVLLDHFVREASSFFIPDKDLLWLEASKLLNTFVNIPTDEVSIASMQFSICFFNQSNPHFMWICA